MHHCNTIEYYEKEESETTRATLSRMTHFKEVEWKEKARREKSSKGCVIVPVIHLLLFAKRKKNTTNSTKRNGVYHETDESIRREGKLEPTGSTNDFSLSTFSESILVGILNSFKFKKKFLVSSVSLSDVSLGQKNTPVRDLFINDKY